MPKLAKEYRFMDLSDYGRSTAVLIANYLKDTRLTPIHITFLFTISGLLVVFFILQNSYLAAGVFLVLKSILDAADGELSRIKNTPSYTGRLLDSISDFILNFLFIFTIGYVTDTSFIYSLLAFLAIQFQGTLYNYYYVILRHYTQGSDETSRIFENKIPAALPGESQWSVNLLFYIFRTLYGTFDKIIYLLDRSAVKVKQYPHWFMSLVSLYGLGFQLLIIAIMLNLGWINYIIPFFLYYTILLMIIISIRKLFINNPQRDSQLSKRSGSDVKQDQSQLQLKNKVFDNEILQDKV